MVVTLDSTKFKPKVGNQDLHIESKEWDNWVKKMEDAKTGPNDLVTYYGQQYKWSDLKKMKGMIVDSATPQAATGEGKAAIAAQVKVIAHAHAVLEKIDQQLAKLNGELTKKGAKLSDAQKAENNKKIESLKGKKAALVAKQKGNLNAYKRMHGAKPLKGKALWWTKAGMTAPKSVQGKDGKGGGVSASMTSGKAATANAPQQQKAAGNAKQSDGKAATTSKGGGFGPASSWGGKAMSGPSFSAGAYAKSLFMEDNIMQSWDGINESQNRGEELMQLLFYYMRMAMSGDLTAMYNMMKAVLYIISKDKALQQVHMASKLIELQDQSRRQTDKLLNFNADQKDPNSQMAFTKLLQQVKSESDSTATSQKLIAQMMEEMAQIVETLTNVTKGALDASGRVLRTVSRFT